MDESREQHITNLLNTVQRGPTCPGPAREAHPSTSDHWRSAPSAPSAPDRGGHCYFDGDEPPLDVLKIDVKQEKKEDEERPVQNTPLTSQRYFPQDVLKAEPQEEREEKQRRGKDKDLEYLFQEVVRENALDQQLKRDLERKKADSKYLDMLVTIHLIKNEQYYNYSVYY
uniref:Uncharacterized protein n=1 Tax=Hucho hucho TaxID=62062 RepID=A0A4W5P4V3_9TELE